MRIDHWPFDRIMQLPDWCFGQRYVVSCSPRAYDGALAWDISEIALPEKFVLWELLWDSYNCSWPIDYIRIALGDQLPTAHAQFMELTPLIMGLGAQGPEPREIAGCIYQPLHLVNIRKPYQSCGRRLVCEAYATAGKTNYTHVIIVVSAMPKEVPDWLISGRVNVQL
jgi:hypothetical protein